MVHLASTQNSKIMNEEELRINNTEGTTTESDSSIWYS